jgi:enoyl-CoA hydratase
MPEPAALSDPAVTYALDGAVAAIRIDDGKANALSHGVLDALGEAFDRAEAEASVVTVTGRPGRFSAGFDLKVMTAGPDQAKDLLAKGARLAMRTYLFPIPVVFGCTGHALAMGAIWLLSGDVRVGADGDFKLGMNEVAIGMPVPRFAVELGRDRLTPGQFQRSVGNARIYDPTAAADAGYLDRVVAADALDAAVREEADALSGLHAGAFKMTRRTVREPVAEVLRAGLQADVDEFFVSS